MDRQKQTRPPKVMERVVRLLVPPVSREHVVGDLSERYVSPRQYLLDALRTVPFVIGSRIRRTQHPVGVAFITLLLWFAVFYGNGQKHWIVATIPTLAGLVAFVLRGVYRVPAPTRVRDAAMDIGVYAAFVVASQAAVALLAPDLLLSKVALFVGFPLSCVILFFVRLQLPGFEATPQTAARSISLQELTQEVRTVEALGRRAVRIEIGACLFVAVGFAVPVWAAPALITRIGHALIVASALFVGGFLYRMMRRGGSMPAGLDFAQSMAFYRALLERSRKLSRTYVWWYVLPLSIGPAVLAIGDGIHRSDPWRTLGILGFIVVFGGILVKLHAVMARGVQKRLDQLGVTEEKTC
jgi:hypothetical protein